MSGLREKQKADRQRRILTAASRLFREAGYGAVRIEDIAAAAEVSVGTFYNYFETKGELLLAIVTMEVEEVLSLGESVVRDPPCSVEVALRQLIGGYFDHSLVYLSKEMWRTALAIAIEAPDTPFSCRYTQLDSLMTDQVCNLIAELQARGLARQDVCARALGEVIFNNLNMMFIEFVKSEPMPMAHLHDKVAVQMAPLAGLLAKV
ncbi:MAG: TetR/AcrR family transcriptional regulator [Pseudomonadota bacterium]|jgi:AcrR family transcriptional regulator